MNRADAAAENDGDRPGRKRLWTPTSVAGGVAVAVAVALYSWLAPIVSQRTGIDLPTLVAGDDGSVFVGEADWRPTDPDPRPVDSDPRPVDSDPRAVESGSRPIDSDPRPANHVSPPAESAVDRRSKTVADEKPLANKSRFDAAKAEVPAASRSTKTAKPADDGLLYGRLREIGRDRFLSVAGVLYTPGSAEGHRLKHLRRHTADQPGRAGKHGVFDGEMEGAIETVDDAYERAKSGQRTTVKNEDGRTIYTVDMGRRVGFVGGREGNRRRRPMARRVRLVMDGNRLITAFPL